ncbi:UDP-N-acetylenolpyruvoylglucosamine reductase [uncultured Flavonifractor sp.]|nr:UDP-N-acetylenolpyruvoylglucosamine reductase [uncultured Flavonifractor sp.]
MDIFSAVCMVLERECPELELRTEEPMARHTTFRVGGPARLMAFPKDKKEIKAAVRAADQMGVVPFFLGNGSNLLVADEGVEAFVIKTGGLDQTREVNRRLRAECGIPLSRLAVAALGRGLTGLEFAHGIPGSLGGAVVMNAGAYGGEMVQVLTAVTYLDKHGQEHTVPAAECNLTYRHSMFTDHPEWLVLEAEMELEQGDAEEIRAKMEDLAQRRKSKQPLEYPSAGSTFKRPEGHFAAALIEQCGLKGLTVGGAQVSEKHAGFVINRGGATCADILKLTEQIKETVLRETGVTLELEVRTLGCG